MTAASRMPRVPPTFFRNEPAMRRYFAELIGTAVLVFGGVGTAVLAGKNVGDLGIACAFGLTLLTMAYAIGPISGCHINPAVTLGLVTVGRITARDAIGYVIGQVVGAIIAAAALFAIARSKAGGYHASAAGFGTNGYGSRSPGGYHLGGVITAEVVLTGLLVFVVLACTDRLAQAQLAGVPIGLTLLLIHLISIPVDNTSVNPARSLAPALFAGHAALSQLWVFILTPCLGGVMGALIYTLIYAGTGPVATKSSVVAADRVQIPPGPDPGTQGT